MDDCIYERASFRSGAREGEFRKDESKRWGMEPDCETSPVLRAKVKIDLVSPATTQRGDILVSMVDGDCLGPSRKARFRKAQLEAATWVGAVYETNPFFMTKCVVLI
jgi:hypothetical protein